MRAIRFNFSRFLYFFSATLIFFSACSQKPDQDHVFTIAWESAPRSIDPRYALDANSQYLENLIHCALIDFDKNGSTRAQLAKSWKWIEQKTLELDIHSGVKFSDGSELKIDDVIATYKFFQVEEKDPSPRKGFMNSVEKIEKIDEDTLRFHLKEADVSFLSNLVVGILPQKIAEAPRFDQVEKYIGCGPFRLTSMDLNNVVLTKNPEFFIQEQIPHLEKVQIKIVQDESTRFAKLIKGEVDLIQNALNREKLKSIEEKYSTQLQVLSSPGLNITYLGFNMRDDLVKKKEVREAIALALDRQVIVDKVLQGRATLATSILVPGDPMSDSSLKNVERNLDQAKALLDEAGLKDPDGDGPQNRFQLSYKTTTDTTRVTIAKAIASQLKEIGIEVDVQSLEWGKFKEDIEKGQAQIWSLSWVGFKDPDIFRYVFATESFPPNGGNRGWYSNKELDQLLTQGKAENDPVKRKAVYQKVQELVASEMPYVYLWHEENFAVINKNYSGFELFADGRLYSLTQVEKKAN